jgi:predicted phage terminase large subunit-like protein
VSEGLQAAASALTLRTGGAASFEEFIRGVRPGYVFYRHCLILIEKLQAVVDGELSRLMVFWPPRHGKSELVSRLLPAYYLYRHPERWVLLASHTADLAYALSRNARNNFTRAGQVATEREIRVPRLSGDAAAVKLWETDSQGGMFAAGVGGAIHGRGFHLGIIDDPYKKAEEAESETIRRKHGDWYEADFTTREEPEAAQVIMHTRFHEDDLAGQVIAEEFEEPQFWTVIDFPGLYEPGRDIGPTGEDASPYAETCDVVPDFRTEVDEALCPERVPAEKMKKRRGKGGRAEYFFYALFQQRPKPTQGTYFQRSYFRIVDRVPEGGKVVRAWDKGGGPNGDPTAGVKMHRVTPPPLNGEKPTGDRVYISDVVRGQWTPGEREAIIKATIEGDGRSVRQWIEQEPGSSGIDAIRETVRGNPGYPVRGETSSGDKKLRADPVAAWGETEGIFLLRGDWNKSYINEMCSFPHGRHDDRVDGTSLAYNKLFGGAKVKKKKAPTRFSSVGTGARRA